MKRIVCGYDGSEPADAAARQAADLATKYGARLSLVYVVEPYVAPVEVPGFSPVDLVEPHRKAGERALSDASARVGQQYGLTPDVEIRVGSPPHEIVDYASEVGADLVVVGSRGQGAVKRFLLGSVADRVTHLANVPVLVVR